MALEAWKQQAGAGPFEVIFDGKVYQNAWWVEAFHCPGEWQSDPNYNPWRVLRLASAGEIEEHGNPTSHE
jgi:hypothetical protein